MESYKGPVGGGSSTGLQRLCPGVGLEPVFWGSLYGRKGGGNACFDGWVFPFEAKLVCKSMCF